MRQYVIDAFTEHVFAGNPAAVCVMDAWLPEPESRSKRILFASDGWLMPSRRAASSCVIERSCIKA